MIKLFGLVILTKEGYEEQRTHWLTTGYKSGYEQGKIQERNFAWLMLFQNYGDRVVYPGMLKGMERYDRA